MRNFLNLKLFLNTKSNLWRPFEDSPENLTHRMHGAATVIVQTDGPATDAEAALRNVQGVTGVTRSEPQSDTLSTFEVDSERGADVRRELAAAIVTRGWGLTELRPLRLSLEDIFLSVITEETGAPAPAPEQEVANA